ncbi:hypothetical protein MJO28_003035 [Puccinia striiformis f. sp. tritici]|uniref:Uncharacterized protein n=1 Tax=Puccinia striiformis f. sp. tritici TaxID=168172 RepID=A0ACC0ESD1_9BASI|nr:hypothetical protein MJO28_003035 [Puccinia striiformis f. sp. tritici]
MLPVLMAVGAVLAVANANPIPINILPVNALNLKSLARITTSQSTTGAPTGNKQMAKGFVVVFSNQT